MFGNDRVDTLVKSGAERAQSKASLPLTWDRETVKWSILMINNTLWQREAYVPVPMTHPRKIRLGLVWLTSHCSSLDVTISKLHNSNWESFQVTIAPLCTWYGPTYPSIPTPHLLLIIKQWRALVKVKQISIVSNVSLNPLNRYTWN